MCRLVLSVLVLSSLEFVKLGDETVSRCPQNFLMHALDSVERRYQIAEVAGNSNLISPPHCMF